MFSVGVLFHILLTKRPIFEGFTYKEVLDKNKRLEMKILDKEIVKKSTESLDLLKKMLEADPKKRITAREALKHEFLKEENSEASIETNDN